jgi:hypothetical protein
VGNPFRNPQAAVDLLYANYDLAGQFGATIHLGCASPGQQNYYEGVKISGRVVGQAGAFMPLQVGPGLPAYPIGKYRPITILGDTTGTNPLGAFINPGNDGRAAGPGLSLSDGAALKVSGVAFDTGLCPYDCIDVFGSFLDLGNVWFGNGGPPPSSYNLHIGLCDGQLWITGPVDMSGDAMTHIQMGGNSQVQANNNTGANSRAPVTLHGALAFPAGFAVCDGNSTFYAEGLEYVCAPGASATNTPTCVVLRNAVISTLNGGVGPNTGNANYFPGDKPPIIQDNAVYR